RGDRTKLPDKAHTAVNAVGGEDVSRRAENGLQYLDFAIVVNRCKQPTPTVAKQHLDAEGGFFRYCNLATRSQVVGFEQLNLVRGVVNKGQVCARRHTTGLNSHIQADQRRDADRIIASFMGYGETVS